LLRYSSQRGVVVCAHHSAVLRFVRYLEAATRHWNRTSEADDQIWVPGASKRNKVR
jgi:hypothetical protein